MNKPKPKTEATLKSYPDTRTINCIYESGDACQSFANAARDYGKVMIVTSVSTAQVQVRPNFDFDEVLEYLKGVIDG